MTTLIQQDDSILPPYPPPTLIYLVGVDNYIFFLMPALFLGREIACKPFPSLGVNRENVNSMRNILGQLMQHS